ncbi:MAG: hypothetical protein JXA45_05490 [Methanomassiliicoccales archaeon]|nr:hypothetical protein [Methanomassiliicoccales archaeon]
MSLLLIISSIIPMGLVGEGSSRAFDGTIASGEYSYHATFSDGQFELHWEVEGEEVRFGMVGRTTGYVAIGFEPVMLMEGADMVIGWVNGSGEAMVYDLFCTGSFGPIHLDIDLGGTDDLLGFGASSGDGHVTVEFGRALVTGDAYDHDIPSVGRLKVIWATGSVFDPAVMPDQGGMGSVEMDKGGSSEDRWSLYFYTVAMGIGSGSLLISMAIVRTKNRDGVRGWHIKLGWTGTAFTALGTASVTVPSVYGGHTPLVLGIGLISVSLLMLGAYMGRRSIRKDAAQGIRRAHTIVSMCALMATVVGLVVGILSLL